MQLLWKKGVAPQKVKHRIPLLGTPHPPDPKELEDFKYLYTNGNTIHNSPKVKRSQGSSTEEWINKTWPVHTTESRSAIKAGKY